MSSVNPFAKEEAPRAPPMSALTSETMHKAFIAIVKLAEFFCTNPRDDEGNVDATSEIYDS